MILQALSLGALTTAHLVLGFLLQVVVIGNLAVMCWLPERRLRLEARSAIASAP
jgi:hypothetical protein